MNEPDEIPDRLTLELQVLPDRVPGSVRVRGFLKSLLRSYRIRCVSIGPTAPPCVQQARQGDGTPAAGP